MSILFVAYDVAADEVASKVLSGAVRALGSRWARPLANLWYIETTASVADVEVVLAPLVGDENGLLIQEVAGEAALANTMLRWTDGSSLIPGAISTSAGSQHRSWQPRLVRSRYAPVGGHLPISETEVATAA